MRKRGRTDANHAAVVAAYRQLGYLVLSLAGLGDGVPDLLVSRRGQLQLVEVKTAKGKLTPDQQQFIADGWPVKIVRSVEDVAR